MAGFELRPYQTQSIQAIEDEWEKGRRKTLLVLPTGCHARGQKVLLASGLTKAVEEIGLSDTLLGADGKPRKLLHLHHGKDDLYKITPIKGQPFIVNSQHMLSLVQTGLKGHPQYPSQIGGKITDVTVSEYLTWSKNKKHTHKLYRSSAIEKFHENDGSHISIDPYFLGVLLSDGNIKNSISITTMDKEIEQEIERQCEVYNMTVRTEKAGRANTFLLRCGYVGAKGGLLHQQLKELHLRGVGSAGKFIPLVYKAAPLEKRLEILAGVIDTDGSKAQCCGYDFISKSRQLSEDVAFIARSAGLAAYVSKSIKTCQGGFVGTYWRVSISGDCSIIPCRVKAKQCAKRKQKKSVLRTGFSVEHIGFGEYFGFTVDGDNRYLLDDFTVTHNCGKTIVFSEIAKRRVDAGERVLILAHRGELLEQAADKLARSTGLACAVEKAENTSVGRFESVVVGSVQTLMRQSRLDALGADRFSTIIVDEAHHALSSSYQAVLDYFSAAKVLGVTATPDRGDRKNLGELFDSLAYEYSLPQAIKDGYLCPIEAQTIPLSLDLSHVGVQAGDFKSADLGDALEPYLEQIAQEMYEAQCMDRKTVVFLPLIATSQKFRDILNRHGFRAAEVNGQSSNRAEVLKDFERGKYNVLCNSMLLTEGWDCPSVDCIVVLRPTKVRSLYCQMVGRGTRLSPETNKDKLLLLDFLWHTERHELCRPTHLIAKNAEVAQAMTKIVEQQRVPIDLEEVEKSAENNVAQAREESLAKQLAEMRTKKRKLVDPLQYEMSIMDADLQNYVPSFGWEMAPPSDKQLKALESHGIFADSIECAGKASLLLNRLDKRKAEGMSSAKQIRLLERYGFKHVGEWSLDQASRLISRLSANGWRVPHAIDPASYVPPQIEKDEMPAVPFLSW